MKKIIVAVIIALVIAIGADFVLKPHVGSLGGTVENYPVLFQNGLQTGSVPQATSSDALIRIGNRIASGSSNGTFIGINSSTSANFVDFQNAGTSEFKVDSSGNVTSAGSFAPSSLTVGSSGVDTTAAGALNIGSTTATSIALGGTSTAVTAITAVPTTAGTITIGKSTGTGTLTFGNSTAGETVSILSTVNTVADVINIASGAAGAATTVNILTGVSTAGAQAVNIANGAAASTISMGNVTGASGISMSVGTGNFLLTGAAGSTVTMGTGITTGSFVMGAALTSGTYAVGGTSTTGTITLGQYTGASASTISIANGATTGAETISIGNGATTTGSAIVKIGSNVTTAGNGTKVVGVSTLFHPTTAVSVSSSTTITAAQLLNAGIILHPSTDNNARTFTLDTGTNIAAAMPGGTAAAGDTFSFEVANGINTVTVAADASSSFFTGTGTMAVGTTRIFNCQFTSSTVYICY